MAVSAGLPGSKDTRVQCVATDVAAPEMEGAVVQIYRRDQHFKGATSLPEQNKQQAGSTLGSQEEEVSAKWLPVSSKYRKAAKSSARTEWG